MLIKSSPGKIIFASEEALEEMLSIGDTIKINDGMGVSQYRYTAYPSDTTVVGEFTYTSTIIKVKEEEGSIVYYSNFEVPTNVVEISSNVDEATITTFADQANANVEVSVDQDDVQLDTGTDVETKASLITNCRYCRFDELNGYDTIKLQVGGENRQLGSDFLVYNNEVLSLALVYNNKIVHNEQLFSTQNIIRKKHTVNIKVYEQKQDVIASNFDNSRFVAINPAIPTNFTDIDIIIRAKYISNYDHNNLFARGGYWFGVRNNGIASMYLQQWVQGRTAIVSDIDYFYRLKSDQNNRFVFYTLVAGNYTIDTLPELSAWTEECSTTLNWLAGQQFYFSFNSSSSSEFWRYGSINLSQSRIYVDGNILFNGDLSTDYTNHNATLTTDTSKGDEIQDATINIYERNASSIDAYCNQNVSYDVSKSGFASVSGTYKVPMNNIDNASYDVEVLMSRV